MSKLTKIIWRLFIFGLICIPLLVLAINFELLGEMPSMAEIQNPSSSVSSEVYSSDGVLLGNYYILNRSNSEFEDISPNAINALIATEDERFLKHSGIDGIAILRAVAFLGKRGGGSTITQQLALNLFAERSTNTFVRIIQKLKEWVLAVKLEKNLTKNEIVTLYLNTVPFGDNVYGIKNASITFFSKNPDQLTVDEAAVLIGMLKANTRYNPRKNPENAKNRRNTVIEQMEKVNFLTKQDAEKYKATPLVLKYKRMDHHEGLAPYFRQVLEQEVKKWCKQNINPETGENYNIYKDGLQIYTTLDSRMQQYAEEAVAEHLKELQKPFANQNSIKLGKIWEEKIPKKILDEYVTRSKRYLQLKDEGKSEKEIQTIFSTPTNMTVFSWHSPNNELDTIMSPLDSIKYSRAFLQSGFMAMDPYTGEIKAWVGGINHEYFQYDHVNKGTVRQVGSTIKPLLYCFAVDNGYSPCSTVETTPQQFKWQPNPYDAGGAKDYASLPMNVALAKSINNASLFLIKQVGIDAFADFANNKCGISSKIEHVPSIALGVTDISLFEMLGAYTMFPNRGIRTEPMFINKIEDKNGNVLYNGMAQQKEIVNAHTAYKMVKMLEGVTQGGGTGVRLRYKYGLTGEIAGKTGTTNNQADAWFLGFTPQLLAGAWVGCDDRFLRFSSTAQGQGAAAALPVWAFFFKKLYADEKLGYHANDKFAVPENFNNCEGYDPSSLPNFDAGDNFLPTDNSKHETNKPVDNNDYEPVENPVNIPLEEW